MQTAELLKINKIFYKKLYKPAKTQSEVF